MRGPKPDTVQLACTNSSRQTPARTACRSMRKTACTVKPATSRTPRKTLYGWRLRAARGRCTAGCSKAPRCPRGKRQKARGKGQGARGKGQGVKGKSRIAHENHVKTIGILGGMSAASTQIYYRELCSRTRERLGGLHSPELLIRSIDFATIETLQMAGKWERAGEILNLVAKALDTGGAAGIGRASVRDTED